MIEKYVLNLHNRIVTKIIIFLPFNRQAKNINLLLIIIIKNVILPLVLLGANT